MSSTPQPRKPARISAFLDRRLNTYALAASAAGVSVLALAGASEAKVIYTETNQVTHQGYPLFIDLNHDGIKDFLLRTTYYVGTAGFVVGVDVAGYRNMNNMVAGQRISNSGYFSSVASALPAGVRIGPEREFPVTRPFMANELFQKNVGTSHYSDVGPWGGKGKGVRNRYLGLKFLIDGKVHYGWARLSVSVAHHRQRGDVNATLTGYAYETVPGKPISTGDTGGSATLGQLATGKQ